MRATDGGFATTEEWCAQGDDVRTFLSDFVLSLPQNELFNEIRFEGDLVVARMPHVR